MAAWRNPYGQVGLRAFEAAENGLPVVNRRIHLNDIYFQDPSKYHIGSIFHHCAWYSPLQTPQHTQKQKRGGAFAASPNQGKRSRCSSAKNQREALHRDFARREQWNYQKFHERDPT
jgi:hypothetical protein